MCARASWIPVSLGHSLKPSPWPPNPRMSWPGCPPPHRLPRFPLLLGACPADLLQVPEGPGQDLAALCPCCLRHSSEIPAQLASPAPDHLTAAVPWSIRLECLRPLQELSALLEYKLPGGDMPVPRTGHSRGSTKSLLPKLTRLLFGLIIRHIFCIHVNIFHIFCSAHVLF